jgi:CRP/FNR family transcriptional regulator, cyclic AMP receptor protein
MLMICPCTFYNDDMPVTTSLLIQIPLFNELSESSAAVVASSSVLRHFRTGQTVVAQGEAGLFLYVPLAGSLQTVIHTDDGRPIGQSPVNVGEPVGWLSIIDGKPFSASLVAAVDCEVLLIPAETARSYLLPEPHINHAVMQLLAQGIRRHMDERRVLTVANAFQRVYLHLHQLAQESAAGGKAVLPKQQAIATSVNTSRETVSRAIQQLIKSGVLHKRGHQVVVISQDKLKALAQAAPSNESGTVVEKPKPDSRPERTKKPN